MVDWIDSIGCSVAIAAAVAVEENCEKENSQLSLAWDDCIMYQHWSAHRIRSFLTMAGAFLGYWIYFNILFSFFLAHSISFFLSVYL